MNKLYSALFQIGALAGCHQMPERSFFYKGKQFPICARCMGAFVGYILGGIVSFFAWIPAWLAGIFCIIMFCDWFLQKTGALESTNTRRLITGILCGFGLMQMYTKALSWILCFVLRN